MPGDDEEDWWRPGPLLPPQDRTWRHPTELAGPSDEGNRPRGDRRVPLGLLAVAGTALLILGVAWMAGASPSTSSSDPPADASPVSRGPARSPGPPPVTSVRVRTHDGIEREVTGVWFDRSGRVLTGSTAVRDAAEILVATDGDEFVAATVLGLDRSGSLALLGTGRTVSHPAVFAGRPLDPGVGARVTTASGESNPIEVSVDGTIRLVDAVIGTGDRSLVGAAVFGPNDTIAAIVIDVVDDELLTVPASRLHAGLTDLPRSGTDLAGR